jgi:hypothetical protein
MLLGPWTGLRGQSVARVTVEENLRSEPRGAVLGRALTGTLLSVVDQRESWVQVELEGWIWARSLQRTDRDGFDLVVSGAGGENLRDTPSGTILARVDQGMLFEELERSPGWIHVRRMAWVWAASLDLTADSGVDSAAAPPTVEAAGRFTSAGPEGAAILTAPDGDTLARTVPRADLAVLFREGSWVRVRVEGWAWLPASEVVENASASDTSSLTPTELTADPGRYRGRMVVWDVQFVSLERAESVRTDFFEGEPFLLSRFGGPDGAFVYVAVPPDRLQEVQGLIPLERLRVTARIRTGASSLTGTPIVDLIQLERSR